MITMDPFNRLSAPELAASPITRYSAEECQALLESGQITPPHLIPSERQARRVSLPENWGRGAYGFGNAYSGGAI